MPSSPVKKAVSVALSLFLALVSLIISIPAYVKHNLVLWIYGRPGDVLAPVHDVAFLTEHGDIDLVSWMIEIEGRVDIKQLRELLLSKCSQKRLAKFSSFPVRERGTVLWRRDRRFSIERHVKEYPEPARSPEHLRQIIAECLTPSYDMSDMSPWTIQLIQTGWGDSVLLSNSHHSLTDGVGTINLFNQVLADSPGVIPARRNAGTLARLMAAATGLLEWLQLQAATPPTFMAEKLASPPQGTCRVAWTKPLSVSQLNSIRKSLGSVTLNDIMCGIIWEATCQYTALKAIPTDQGNYTMTLAVSMRSGQDYTPANRVSLLTVYVSLSDDLSLEQRIGHLSQAIRQRKESEPVIVHHTVQPAINATSLCPGSLDKMVYSIELGTSILVSNIAGPQETVRIMGRDVKRIIFIPTGRLERGLSFGISSYDGELRVAILDLPGVADTQLFIQLIETAADSLLTNAAAKAGRTATRSSGERAPRRSNE